ncbi:CST complex subunit STN1-like [Penaeus indicus]|uniref:CST complex subunit STN1-like n=1 Tax=Penaeus indicus TaxID=29960 RepID=UPI00300CF137
MNSTTHVRLFLCELETEEDKFYLGEEEIVRVDIIGTVVYISQRERVITFQIDDGTGIINCAKFTSPESEGDCNRQHSQREKGPNHSLKNLLLSLVPPENPLKLGDLVNVRGRLNIFRDQPQIIVNSLRHVHDVNEEWFRVLEINALRKSKAVSMNNAKESDIHSSDRLHCFFQSE